MKKIVKKVFGFICSFILGAQAKVFASEQTDVFRHSPEPKSAGSIIDVAQPAVYGPAPDPSFSTLTGGQIFSIVTSVLLFIIGIIVILNKKITKSVKVITIVILSIVILSLLLFIR